MNAENLFYAVLPYAMLFIIALLAFYSLGKIRRDGIPTEIPAHAEVIAGIGVLLATLASVTAVIMFALAVGGSFLEKALTVAWLVAFQAVEFTAAFYLARYWQQRNSTMVVMVLLGISLGVISSIVAAQGFLATRIDDLEASRMRESVAFQNAQNALESAQHKAESLAMSSGDAEAAKRKSDKLQSELDSYLASNAKNSSGATVGTVQSVISRYGCTGFYAGLCAEVSRIKGEIAEQQAVIAHWQEYQGALAHAEGLAAQPLPSSGVTSATLPWITGIAQFTGYTPEQVKANYPFFISIGGEFIALVFGFIWGANRASSKNAGESIATPPAQTEKPGLVDRFGRAFGEGAAAVAARTAPARLVANTQDTTRDNTQSVNHAMRDNTQSVNHAMRDNTQSVNHAMRDTRNVGEVYNCKGCGAEYKARTTWHVWCDTCRESRVKAAKRSKAKNQ